MTVSLAGCLAEHAAAFASAAEEHDVVPVAVEIHADSLTPVGAFRRFVGTDVGFLLESVEDGQRYGRFSFLGRRPLGHYEVGPSRRSAGGVLATWTDEEDPLSVVEQYLARTTVAELVGVPQSPVPLRSGVVGLFGWECARHIERLPAKKPTAGDQPDGVLVVIGELVVFDHWRQVITLIANVDTRQGAGDISGVETRLQEMVDALAATDAEYLRRARGRSSLPVAPSKRSMSSEQFQLLVRAAREEIAAGEVFQIVLSQRFDIGPIDDPFSVYRCLRQLNPSAYLYYLQLDGVTVVGSSPEPLVRVRSGTVTVRPIAGSRPRGDDEHENAMRAASLAEDPKEIAEHVMLVDLGRNDVGRVATYGSVRVEELMTVETYSHIMHMTSQVSGTLRDGVSAVDVLRATFPAGTLSGAPKVRAMELITEMEPESRGLYGGAVAYFDSTGNLDAAILIRTLVVDATGSGSVQAGAGIVWDSDPVSEDEECLAKAEAVLRAVGGASDE
jgi:anthranilate synthase component I